jgi:hypothetical protein
MKPKERKGKELWNQKKPKDQRTKAGSEKESGIRNHESGIKKNLEESKPGFSFCPHPPKKPDQKVGHKRPKVQFCFVV